MRYAATSTVDTLMEREGGFTLEELLEEDELLQECKSQNTKLLELCVLAPSNLPSSRRNVPTLHSSRRSLCEPDSLAKMITYIVTMPSESDTEARRYKCETLACHCLAAGGSVPSPCRHCTLLSPCRHWHRYPYVASEVLSCDLSAVQDVLLSVSSGLLERVLSILQQPPPLAPVLAGYCSKVVVALFKSVPEQFSQFFTDHWAAEPDSLIRCGRAAPG